MSTAVQVFGAAYSVYVRAVRLALEELSFFSSEVKILGTYPASPRRAAWSST